jgi:HEAT repeat protein
MSTNSKKPKRKQAAKEMSEETSAPASTPKFPPVYWILLGSVGVLVLIGVSAAIGLAMKGSRGNQAQATELASNPPAQAPAEPAESPVVAPKKDVPEADPIVDGPELIPAPAAVLAASTDVTPAPKDKKPPETVVAQKEKEKEKEPKKDAGGKWPTEVLGKDLDRWMVEIKDPDPSNRQAAIRSVVQFGPAGQKALNLLAGRLYPANEADTGVRADAAIAIRMLGITGQNKQVHDNVLAALGEALSDTQRPVRLQAATTLGQLGPDAKGAIIKLAGALKDPVSWEVRMAAARALSSVARGEKGPDPTALTALINSQVLSDPCASVRMEIVTALSVLGSTEKLQPEEKKALEYRLKEEKDHRVKIWVRVLLMLVDEKGHMTKANFDALLKEFDSEDAAIRAQAVRGLGTLGRNADKQPGVAAALTKALSDRDLEVRLAAVAALPRLGSPQCIPVLTKILKDDKEEMAVRTQVARSVWTMGRDGKAFVDELTGLLTHKNADLVSATITGLAAFGDLAQPAVPALKRYDPEMLSFDEHTKEVNRTAADFVTKTKEAMKAAADEAVKHINDSKSSSKK